MRYLAALEACPPASRGNIERMRDLQPDLWARLTADGPIEIGELEHLVMEVAPTVHAMGWEAAKDLHDITLEPWAVRAFRVGVCRLLSTFRGRGGDAR